MHFWLHHTAHCAENIVLCCVPRFCVSRKGGTGGCGWCHPQGDLHMVAARLGCQSTMVGTRWPIFCHGQAWKMLLSPCRGLISGRMTCMWWLLGFNECECSKMALHRFFKKQVREVPIPYSSLWAWLSKHHGCERVVPFLSWLHTQGLENAPLTL